MIHRPYQGIVCFQNVIWFLWYMPIYNFIYTHRKSAAFHVQIVMNSQVLNSPMNYGRTKGGGGAAGLQTPQNQNLKNTDFVGIMVSKVLRDFPFS
jgi:hypothetical protein